MVYLLGLMPLPEKSQVASWQIRGIQEKQRSAQKAMDDWLAVVRATRRELKGGEDWLYTIVWRMLEVESKRISAENLEEEIGKEMGMTAANNSRMSSTP